MNNTTGIRQFRVRFKYDGFVLGHHTIASAEVLEAARAGSQGASLFVAREVYV